MEIDSQEGQAGHQRWQESVNRLRERELVEQQRERHESHRQREELGHANNEAMQKTPWNLKNPFFIVCRRLFMRN